MSFTFFGCKCKISVIFVAIVAFMLFIDRTGMMSITLIGVLVHESGHIITLRAFGQMPTEISLRPGALSIKKPKIKSNISEFIILISGAGANFLVAIIVFIIYKNFYFNEYMPFIIVTQVTLGVINLSPVIGLDGGDILKLIISGRKGERTADNICFVISAMFAAGLLLFGLILFIYGNTNPSIILFAVYLVGVMILKRKY